MKFAIKHRWTGSIIFEAELGVEFEKADEGIKLGAAVKMAIKAGANLAGAYLADAYLADANLAGAYLADANLAGAYLAGAYLADANLAGAYLADAKNVPDFTMPDGLKFSEYLRHVVPALLTAGGKTVKEILDAGAWDCHSWDNCPMAMAFGVHRVEDVPPLYRARAQEFVKYFDARMIPAPKPEDESTEAA